MNISVAKPSKLELLNYDHMGFGNTFVQENKDRLKHSQSRNVKGIHVNSEYILSLRLSYFSLSRFTTRLEAEKEGQQVMDKRWIQHHSK